MYEYCGYHVVHVQLQDNVIDTDSSNCIGNSSRLFVWLGFFNIQNITYILVLDKITPPQRNEKGGFQVKVTFWLWTMIHLE